MTGTALNETGGGGKEVGNELSDGRSLFTGYWSFVVIIFSYVKDIILYWC